MTFLKVAMRGGLIRGLNDTLFRIFVRNASLAISGAGFICDKPPRKLFSHAFLNMVSTLGSKYLIGLACQHCIIHGITQVDSAKTFCFSVGPKIVVSTGL